MKARHLARATLVAAGALALTLVAGGVAVADSPPDFKPGVPEGTSDDRIVDTSVGLPVVVDPAIRAWAAKETGKASVSDQEAAALRAATLTRGLSPRERGLLRSGGRLGITMDVENQKIVAVVERAPRLSSTERASTFALTQGGTCSDNANNKSCVKLAPPGSSVSFTGGAGESWIAASPTGYSIAAVTWYSPRNMKGTITLVSPYLSNYTYALPPDYYMDFTSPQKFKGMKHG